MPEAFITVATRVDPLLRVVSLVVFQLCVAGIALPTLGTHKRLLPCVKLLMTLHPHLAFNFFPTVYTWIGAKVTFLVISEGFVCNKTFPTLVTLKRFLPRVKFLV